MEYLDKRIQELSTEQDAQLLRASQPLGFKGLVARMKGCRLSWLFWLTWLAHIVLLIAGIILGWKFLGASDALAATKAGIGAATCLIVAVQLLVGLAPRMHAERLKREIKRTQIMVLADRQGA